MTLYKVKVDTYWIVEADDDQKAKDRVFDDFWIDLASDYDTLDAEVVKRKDLSKDDLALIIKKA
jgi:hypothetical protein